MNDKLTKAVTENGQYERLVSMRKTWKRRLGSRKLLPMTVKVPLLQVDMMEFLVKEGFFVSKSEFVRYAIEEKLDNYLLTIERQAAVKKIFDHEYKKQWKSEDYCPHCGSYLLESKRGKEKIRICMNTGCNSSKQYLRKA